MLTFHQREKLAEFIGKALFTGSFIYQEFEVIMESATDAAVERSQSIIKKEVRNFFTHRQQLKRPTAEELRQLTRRLEERLSGEISMLDRFTFCLTGENITIINRTLKAISRCTACEENLRQETRKLQSALESVGPRLVHLAVDCHTPSLLAQALDLRDIASDIYRNINVCGLPEPDSRIDTVEITALEHEMTRLYIDQVTGYLYDQLDKSLENYNQLPSTA